MPVLGLSLMRFSLRHKLTLPLLCVLLTLFVLELGFRIYHFVRLEEGDINFLHLPKDFFVFDENLGYRYEPNQSLTFEWFNANGKILRTNQVTTNNHGRVSPRPYSYSKPKGEYRIAIVGDSLAACIHNDLPWATTLEDVLNQDTKLKNKLGVSSFKVLNLATDGIGVAQMPQTVEHEVSKYNVDLTLVHFITADIYRRFSWRRTVPLATKFRDLKVVLNCVSLPADLTNKDCELGNIIGIAPEEIKDPTALKAIRKAVAWEVKKRVPWATLYPQFLSWAMKGKLEQLLGRNPYHILTSNIEDKEESKKITIEAIRRMKQLSPNIEFLLTPTYWEIVYGAVPGLAGQVMDALSEIPITPMLTFLPNVRDPKIIDRWINHPYDMHWSNLGARLYAQAVQKYLRVHFKTETLYSFNSSSLPYN